MAGEKELNNLPGGKNNLTSEERRLKRRKQKKRIRFYLKLLAQMQRRQEKKEKKQTQIRENTSQMLFRNPAEISRRYSTSSKSVTDFKPMKFKTETTTLDSNQYEPPDLNDLTKPIDVNIKPKSKKENKKSKTKNETITPTKISGLMKNADGDMKNRKFDSKKSQNTSINKGHENEDETYNTQTKTGNYTELHYKIMCGLCISVIVVLIIERAIDLVNCPFISVGTVSEIECSANATIPPAMTTGGSGVITTVPPQLTPKSTTVKETEQLFFSVWHLLTEIDGVSQIFLSLDDVNAQPKKERADYISQTMKDTLTKFGFVVKSVKLDVKTPPTGEVFGTNVFESVYISYVDNVGVLRAFGFPNKNEEDRFIFEDCFFDELHNYFVSEYKWTSQYLYPEVSPRLYQAMSENPDIEAKTLPSSVPAALRDCKNGL